MEPIGCKGSIAHIMTNEKLDAKDKAATVAQIAGQQLKDTVTIAGVTTVAGGTAAVAAAGSKGFVNALKGIKDNVANALSSVSIDGKNLKDVISNSGIYKKVKALPTPAKAAVMVGSTVAALLGSVGFIKSAGDSGYIEAKNEKETIKV